MISYHTPFPKNLKDNSKEHAGNLAKKKEYHRGGTHCRSFLYARVFVCVCVCVCVCVYHEHMHKHIASIRMSTHNIYIPYTI